MDPVVQKELKSVPYACQEMPDGSVGIRVHYMDEDKLFSPEQITAMLFTKLKIDAAVALQTQIYDCVITVPSYFTNAERKALQDAAGIAGLNCLRLVNENHCHSPQLRILQAGLASTGRKSTQRGVCGLWTQLDPSVGLRPEQRKVEDARIGLGSRRRT